MLNVSNLCSPSSEREVANQFEIRLSRGIVFQSYNSLIALSAYASMGRNVINERYYKYSPTTTKYTAVFFNCYDAKELHQRVKDGSIELVSNDEFQKLIEEIKK